MTHPPHELDIQCDICREYFSQGTSGAGQVTEDTAVCSTCLGRVVSVRKTAKAPRVGPYVADWNRVCTICSTRPVVNATGLCGPCTFGEAATAGGNW